MTVEAAVESSAIDDANDPCEEDGGGLEILDGMRRRNERICGRVAATSSAVTSCSKASTESAAIVGELDRSGHPNSYGRYGYILKSVSSSSATSEVSFVREDADENAERLPENDSNCALSDVCKQSSTANSLRRIALHERSPPFMASSTSSVERDRPTAAKRGDRGR